MLLRRNQRRAVVPALLAVLAACSGSARNVVVVTMDTLRQDHLGAYGADVDTPGLDRLAREGFVFEDAFATAPTTLPSHTSLFTGTYPHTHGVRRNGLNRVPAEAETLAEALQGRGYATAAFVGTAVLDSFYGLDQGFDVYEDEMTGDVASVQEQRRASRVVDGALAWLAARDDDAPFFLWVHVFDPHGPYDPPPPFDTRYYTGDDPRDPANTSMSGIPLVFYQDLDGITDVEYPLARYKGEISYMDGELARLFDAVRARDDETLFVLTADHGESLGENRYWFDHGETLHDACVRVPLIVHAPWRGGGERIAGPVSHVDVLPTVFDLLGLRMPETFEGRSLAPHFASERVPDRFVYFETFLPSATRRAPLFGVRSADWKATFAGGRARLYDARTDRGEATNLAKEEPETMAELHALLDAYASREPLAQEELTPTPEQEEKLRALGYM